MTPADVAKAQEERTIFIEKEVKYLLRNMDQEFKSVVDTGIRQGLFSPMGGSLVFGNLKRRELAPDEEKLFRSAAEKMLQSKGWKIDRGETEGSKEGFDIYYAKPGEGMMSVHLMLGAIQ